LAIVGSFKGFDVITDVWYFNNSFKIPFHKLALEF
jgi:hypothetical protein